MTDFKLYTFFLCLIVFVSLTFFFAFLIFYIGKQKICMIKNGLADERIIKSVSNRYKLGNRIIGTISKIASIVICLFITIPFALVAISSSMGNRVVKDIPAIKVVASTSMSEKYENNTYLFTNNLDNQLQLFDVVLLHKLPKEEDLKLYDIVVYEHISGTLLFHRIVGIEEPNEEHPNERYFLLQGDAVHYPDSFPVRYEQMKSIYYGERVPNVGSFIFFMQSPSGLICLLLILCCMILMPIADSIVLKREEERYRFLQEMARANAYWSDGPRTGHYQ